MKNIFYIFRSDSKRLFSNVVAIVIIMGLSIIPALYAWFNILSNWDPYGAESTARINIAVYSEDSGYSLSGISLNVGESVIEALKGNDTIGWQFAENRDEVIHGVESGDFYAALILPEDFTSSLVSFTGGNPSPASIEYFENSKKNAIATKITSKVEKTVQTQVATSFVETIAKTSWTVSEALGEKADDTTIFDNSLNVIKELQGDLSLIESALYAMEQTGESAVYLSKAGRGVLAGEQDILDRRVNVLENLESDVTNAEDRAIKAIEDAKQKEILDNLEEIDTYTAAAIEEVNGQAAWVRERLERCKTAILTLKGNIGDLDSAMASYEKVITDGGSQLQATIAYVNELNVSLSEMAKELSNIREGGIYNSLIDMIGKDPQQMAQFLSAPVELRAESIYPIENYGSAMAPFYTVLAIWVGALILVALIHVEVKDEPEHIGAKPWQKYFGRYITFFLIGQAQALITLFGDLFFVGIQCINPVRFVFAGMVISFVFTIFIYSLTIAMGNVGEAVAVIVMVIQVAGSGGTFPIEVLPSVYQNIYEFLPFPYAMNALRECVGGMYEDSYEMAIIKLLSYVLISLFVGLIVAILLRSLNKRIEVSKKRSGLMV